MTETVNPEWRAAIDQAMQKSLMNREALASLQQNSSNAEQSGAPISPPPASQQPPIPIHYEEDDDADDEDFEEEDVPPPPRRPMKLPKGFKHIPEPSTDSDEDEDGEEDDEDGEEDSDNEEDNEEQEYEQAHERVRESKAIAQEEKMDMLIRLQGLIDSGEYKAARVFTMDDKLEAIRFEYFRADREVSRKRGIRMMQKGLVTTALGIETLNRRFNFFGLNLDGYSRSILISINDFSDVLEELHFLYRDSFRMRPEMKLIMMMSTSAWMYSASRAANGGGHNAAPPTTTESTTNTDTSTNTRMRGPSASAKPSGAADLGGLAMLSTILR